MLLLLAVSLLVVRVRPILKVAPRRAEPSEFRLILPGSVRRDSKKANLTLGRLSRTIRQRPLDWVNPVRLINQFQSRRAAPYSHLHERTIIFPIISIAYGVTKK